MNVTTFRQLKDWVKTEYPEYNWNIRDLSHRDGVLITITTKSKDMPAIFSVTINEDKYYREPNELLRPYFHFLYTTLNNLEKIEEEAMAAYLASDNG